MDNQYRIIATATELAHLVTELESVPVFAVDLEADSMHHFKEKVCLLQPDSADTWAKTAMMRYLAGRAEKDRGRLAKAKEAAQKALEIDPSGPAQQVLERIDAALETMEEPT